MGYCLYLTFLHSTCFLYYEDVLYIIFLVTKKKKKKYISGRRGIRNRAVGHNVAAFFRVFLRSGGGRHLRLRGRTVCMRA